MMMGVVVMLAVVEGEGGPKGLVVVVVVSGTCMRTFPCPSR